MGLINVFLNYYRSLRCNQLSKDHLSEIQKQRFGRLLHHAAKTSKFYQDLYKGIDIDNSRFQDLPIVTKSAMMDNFDRFVTDKRIKLEKIQSWLSNNENVGKLYLGEFLPIPTSGSIGEYALVLYHRKALDLIQAGHFICVYI